MRLRSRNLLLQFMRFHEITSAYGLARATGLKPAVVGHIVSGRRNTCSAATAEAIETALQSPRGMLFEPRTSRVAGDTPRKRAA